jgi:hypothetical protein
MSDVLNTLEFVIRSLLNAKQHLFELAEDLPMQRPLDEFDVHSLSVTLEAIAEYIDIDSLHYESVVHEVQQESPRDADPPSDVTIPSPPRSYGGDVRRNDSDTDKSCFAGPLIVSHPVLTSKLIVFLYVCHDQFSHIKR